MAFGIDDALGAVGLIGGLFGRRKQSNPYQGQLNNAVTGQQNLAGQYGQMARQYGQNYAGLNTTQNATYGQLRNALTDTNPYSENATFGILQRANAGNQDALRQAQAALSSNLAARGMLGSGMDAGAQSALLGSYLAQRNQNANDLALSAAQQRQANLQTLYGLDADRANNAYSQQQAALGNQTGINSGILSALMGLSGQRDAQNAAASQQQAASLASLGSLLPDVMKTVRTTKTGTPPIAGDYGNSGSISGYTPVTTAGLGYRFR